MGECLMTIVALTLSLGFFESILKAALGLGFVIFVHELGHFLVAKACGVKCEKFYVGFDVPIGWGKFQLPRTLFRKQWGETEYGIGIVPLGGYVKMLGQDDNPANAAREAERIRVAREEGGTEHVAPVPMIDPRSYPAKPVWQRLAIISAGVIMNLIFAVIFASVAYRMGVSYTPTVVGTAIPGLSAWTVGLRPGDRVLQMGRDGEPSQNLRFHQDMMVRVALTGVGRDLDLLVQPYRPAGEPAATPIWKTVRLRPSLDPQMKDRPVIGIAPSGTTVIGTSEEDRKLLPQCSFHHTVGLDGKPLPVEEEDRIVAINGEPIADYVQLQRAWTQHAEEELTLTIERPKSKQGKRRSEGLPTEVQTLQVKVPPMPARGVGIELTVGPVVAIQEGSPAAAAGFQIGDRLVAIQGQPIGDPLGLIDTFRRLSGQEVRVQIVRERQSSPTDLVVKPLAPSTYQIDTSPNRPVGLDGVGIAVSIENKVARVVPGSPAEAAGVRAGDIVEAADFVAANKEQATAEQELFGKAKTIPLGDGGLSWTLVNDRIQLSQLDTKLKLTLARDGKATSAEMVPVVVADRFYINRGFKPLTMEEVHRVAAWGDSMRLGVRETWESMRQVYFMLYRLVTGEISPMNLGGPVSIATMAGVEASQSTARLLVFLTLLSANLAVVNFLPIPVLDGGHAVFLLYEGIFRRPLNERVAFGLTMLGFCFILGLMLFVLGLDLWRSMGLSG